MPGSTIAFDIEVAGFPWEEVDEITRGYLLNREMDKEKREAVPERTGLYPGLGKIIAIGMWLVAEDRGLILLEGPHEDTRDWKKVPNAKIFRGDERQILEEFWKLVARSPKGTTRLVSFNGRGYDGPVLTIRSAQLGAKPSRNLLGNRYRIDEHCDISEIFTFMGATRERYSLEYWCRRFDVESPKGSIDGSQISRVYRAGRIDDIGEYCLRDARATAQLYQKLAGTMLPLFAGSE
jgi:Predicted 3'-5' exonuclease related to the exonuclease domain of PolB